MLSKNSVNHKKVYIPLKEQIKNLDLTNFNWLERRKWLDKLYRLESFKVLPILREKKGSIETPFKTKDYKDTNHDIKSYSPFLCRETLDREIVIDLDNPEWKNNRKNAYSVSKHLKEREIPHYIFYTGGKGIHIHIFLDVDIQITETKYQELKEKKFNLKYLREQLFKEFKNFGISKDMDNQLIKGNHTLTALGSCHRKTNNYKLYIGNEPEDLPNYPEKINLEEGLKPKHFPHFPEKPETYKDKDKFMEIVNKYCKENKRTRYLKLGNFNSKGRKGVEELKKQISLKELIGNFLDVEEGTNKAQCPFHMDNEPSLHIYRNAYHCFGCEAHGDHFDFLINYKEVDVDNFKEAKQYLEENYVD